MVHKLTPAGRRSAMRDDLPTYSAADQGLDQDRDTRTAATVERDGRGHRTTRDRGALIAQLNDSQSTIADLVSKVRQPLGTVGEGSDRVRRIVIYLRVSTEEQAKQGGEVEGFSIPYQREACL